MSVDEKPTIQALERASGYVLTSSGKIVHGLKSTYKRHGTVNLFAALEVATGVIRGKTTQTKKRVDFQAFMTDLVAEQPPDREIHVILDNLATHKKNDDWLAAHPNVTFHFTPTSASWLNQVEIWFGIFSRKALAGASFASIAQLVQAIRDFTEAYNRNAAPFVWRKREVKGDVPLRFVHKSAGLSDRVLKGLERCGRAPPESDLGNVRIEGVTAELAVGRTPAVTTLGDVALASLRLRSRRGTRVRILFPAPVSLVRTCVPLARSDGLDWSPPPDEPRVERQAHPLPPCGCLRQESLHRITLSPHPCKD